MNKDLSDVKKWFFQNVKMTSRGYNRFSVEDIRLMCDKDFEFICNHYYPEVIPNFLKEKQRNNKLIELGI